MQVLDISYCVEWLPFQDFIVLLLLIDTSKSLN